MEDVFLDQNNKTKHSNKRPRALDILLDLLADETNIALWIMSI